MDEFLSLTTPFNDPFPTAESFKQAIITATVCTANPSSNNQSQNLRFLAVAPKSNSNDNNLISNDLTPRCDAFYLPLPLATTILPEIEGYTSDGSQSRIVPDYSGNQSSCPCQGFQPFPPFVDEKQQRPRLHLTHSSELPGCHHYIALSYCWQHTQATSLEAEMSHEFYTIDTPTGPRRNKVATSILDRAIAYAAERSFKLLWIDQECINQDDEEDKQQHIAVMDDIYHQSQLVAAVLTNPVVKQDHIDFMIALGEHDELVGSWDSARELLALLLSDRWYKRAWTLHEALSSTRVVHLLVPCALPSDRPSFLGHMSNQVVLSQRLLKYISQKHTSGFPPHQLSLLDISTATLVSGQQLSAHSICKELLGRGIQMPWDLLSIMTNCCRYNVRIDKGAAMKAGLNVGICMFALALMNGDLSILRAVGIGEMEMAFSWLPVPVWSLKAIAERGWKGRENGPEEHCCRFDLRHLQVTRSPLSAEGLLCTGRIFPLHFYDDDLFWPDQPLLYNNSVMVPKYYWRVQKANPSESGGSEENPIKLILTSSEIHAGLCGHVESARKFYLLV